MRQRCVNWNPQGNELMNDNLLLILAAFGDSNIPFLTELRKTATIVVGDSARDVSKAAADADIILALSRNL